jgi:CRISPR-associated endonuclease Csn1
MKKILGLDLGTNSIGWAHVIQGDTPEQSSIERIGVRVNPLTTDEQTNFEKGKPITINADRTLKRGARRNLDRYQLRRKYLSELLKREAIIQDDTKLTEDGKNTTHETWRLRALSVVQKIEKDQLARVFFAINKKRGYKSSRKAKNDEEGQAIDGMSIAKRLYDEHLTPGELVYLQLTEGKKFIPTFYRSDLQAEFDKVWNYQKQFYPDIFTNGLYKELQGKGQRATSAIFWTQCNFNIAETKDLEDDLKNEKTVLLSARDKKKLQSYNWRSRAIKEKLEKEKVAYVLTEINNNLNTSSGYLGEISDRSKELYFNKQTVGQYLYKKLTENPHTSLKNKVFYRQDYMDEFEAIWTEQSKYHKELTPSLKEEIRDVVIFYQRKLKSQKGLISFCEFEFKNIEIEINGKKHTRTIGQRVIPRSSPLFQEFKIWQTLNNVLIKRKGSRKRVVSTLNNDSEIFALSQEDKNMLFDELNIKGNLKSTTVLQLLNLKPSEWELNFTELQGNSTNKVLYEAYFKILEMEGYDVKELLNIKLNKDDIEFDDLSVPSSRIKEIVCSVFDSLHINTTILDFNAELEGNKLQNQSHYQLWHLLYSYEGDDSQSGNEQLINLLGRKFGFNAQHGKILANIVFSPDYGSLSAKAIHKIYPYLKENKYSEACELAGYKHSAASLTKDEIASRTLNNKLELLKKNSLRNPVVEKILNQMVNVVNTLIDVNSVKDDTGKIKEYYKFDQVHIELARELKKSAKERAELTSSINSAKIKHDKIFNLLQKNFGIANPTRNDIIKYKLYEELKNNGYKDLYTNEYIPRELLFSKEIDVDHIIPQARLFDDSFSNKTICFRKDNIRKGNRTATDFIQSDFGIDAVEAYLNRVESLYETGKKNAEEGISKAKWLKLQKKETEIGDGFIERDLRDTQYIAKKAKEMLLQIAPVVVSTTGSITDRLRQDWGIVNIMQELNFDKYKAVGLTDTVLKKDGTTKERIVDWNKRNDHRHHAMDALTVAFTNHNHIQYLNYLNARYNETHKFHSNIKAIENKETHIQKDDTGNAKRVFNLPIPGFRQLAKSHLECILVSHKAKNKVVTKNKNKIITNKKGHIVKTELTPRGQLHKETVYGKIKIPVIVEEKVTAKFDADKISHVNSAQIKALLLQRLSENDNDPKKAFAGKNALTKNPIYMNAEKTSVLPEKVKLTYFEDGYTIRKDVTPDLKIDKVLDEKVKQVLQARLNEYNNDSKKAFTDLDKNPIWLNKDKGIAIKRVTITGVSNAEPLHYKKDHYGKPILDAGGHPIPADFVSTGNNHHVAIYRDEKGELQDRVVSLYEAVQLVNIGQPIIDKEYNKGLGWQFLFTMKQNEYFVFPNERTGFNPNEINLLDGQNAKMISPNLFRVQKMSKVSYGNSSVRDYVFRSHLETNIDDRPVLKNIAFKSIKSLSYLESSIKVRVDHIGRIIAVGEY